MKRLLGLLLLSVITGVSFGQGESFTAYLDQAFEETSKRKAYYVRNLLETASDQFNAEVRNMEDNSLKMEGVYIRENASLKEHGIFTFYYPDGKVESRGQYDRGYKVGAWERYTSSGAKEQTAIMILHEQNYSTPYPRSKSHPSIC